ncbi:MAG TPA: hypothetical protein VFD32_21235, partial [Dehalococcoidia bacterium]|nr:hypothetical protein [Dehalococcoidia bacterium]
TVRGSGFAPHERLTLTLTVASGRSNVVRSAGSLMQSSGNSLQSSSTTVQADAQGAVRWTSTVIASSDAELSVVVRGDRGNSAEARVSGTRPR